MCKKVKCYDKCSDKEVEYIINVFSKQFLTSSEWSIEKIDIRETFPLCKYVFSKRLYFAKKSFEKCTKYNIPLFLPYKVYYIDGTMHLIPPPVVEERNGTLFIGDGMHRLYNLLQNNLFFCYVLVTHNCVLPLPGKPQKWDNVVEHSTQLSCDLNFEGFNRSFLTGYSKFSNSDIFWKKGEKEWDLMK